MAKKKKVRYYAEGGLVSDSEDTGTAKARSEAIADESVRKKLKDHAKYWAPEYKAKNPEPDWSTKNRFDDDKIEISPLVKIYKKGGLVKGPGGPKDDKVPAKLSNGEFVVKASTVKKIGGGSTHKGAERLSRLDKRRRLYDYGANPSSGIPEGEKIPAGKLKAAANSDDPEKRRDAIRAETMKKWHHGGRKKVYDHPRGAR